MLSNTADETSLRITIMRQQIREIGNDDGYNKYDFFDHTILNVRHGSTPVVPVAAPATACAA